MSKVCQLRKITTAEAAAIMGKDQLFVRHMIQEEKVDFCLFKKDEGSKRGNYFIIPSKFAAFLGITVEQLWDMLPEEASEE